VRKEKTGQKKKLNQSGRTKKNCKRTALQRENEVKREDSKEEEKRTMP